MRVASLCPTRTENLTVNFHRPYVALSGLEISQASMSAKYLKAAGLLQTNVDFWRGIKTRLNRKFM